ncbi:Transcription factor BIM1 [Acorus gramineus]|uniref:Transcription factor BIM1 n=1 Tax=Acorus gramineus TaxID=55184 RepID=A0AAV9B8E6_ACOGR|nr:Transcription factor BIM1 [Acorus gramineus]
MGLQGNKTTLDFLSLYKDSSFQDSGPSSQGYFLKTQNLLQPLEKVPDTSPGTATPPNPPNSAEHVLPGGIGTFSISHVSYPHHRTAAAVVKPEAVAYDRSNRKGSSGEGPYGRGFTLWDESAAAAAVVAAAKDHVRERQPATRVTEDKPGQQRWTSPYGASRSSSSSFGSLSSSRQLAAHDKQLRVMEAARSGKGFDDDDDDDEDFGKRDVSAQKELTVKVDGKGGGGGDQKANTPRSKHSATEQRRRSKINDRFQILRDLIPHSDQKRDKASFLLEVIEYIQFLQEKVNKYESTYPGWTQENAKLMPWKNSQGPGESIVDHSMVIKNGPASGFMFSGNENSVPVAPMISSQTPAESDNIDTGAAYKPMEVSSKVPALPVPLQPNLFTPTGRVSGFPQQRLVSDTEMASQNPQAQWLRACPNECLSSTNMLSEQEELAIDEGTISISSAYSEGLLNTLTHALQSSGIDLSQANISVQINLGKRAISKPSTVTSVAKDQDDPSTSNRTPTNSRVAEESEQAQKRQRTDNSR